MVVDQATPEGTIIKAEDFKAFDPIKVVQSAYESEGWSFEKLENGVGGYFKLKISKNDRHLFIHCYINSVGWRHRAHSEKGIQFPANHDVRGFNAVQNESQVTLIIGVYKRNADDKGLIVGWHFKDWGNRGKPFNCFVDTVMLAEAYKYGLFKGSRSEGKTVLVFKPELLEAYTFSKDALHGYQAFNEVHGSAQADPILSAAMVNPAPKDLIEHVHSYITGEGYRFKRLEVANFYLSLRTKPFVILAGISGTGKTQLPSLFAEATGMRDDQVIQVAVRPDWTDGSDLIGYIGIDDGFKPRDLTLAIQRAKADPNKPYFFILDEMNLARVEHYFSDFLSVIESRKRTKESIVTRPMLREESIASATNRDQFEGLTWPANLYLIGTVNMDETTHAFSRKVLDRANAIEMNDVDLNWPEEGAKVDAWSGIHNDALRTEYLIANELSMEDRAMLDSKGVMAFMKRVNEILKKADLHFAYRVRDEMAFYLLLNLRSGLMEHEKAIDFQLMQKVLPRVHGSSGRTERVLLDLLNLLTEIETAGTDHKTDDLEQKVKESGNERYERSVEKILFMLRRFEEDRFTSFWL